MSDSEFTDFASAVDEPPRASSASQSGGSVTATERHVTQSQPIRPRKSVDDDDASGVLLHADTEPVTLTGSARSRAANIPISRIIAEPTNDTEVRRGMEPDVQSVHARRLARKLRLTFGALLVRCASYGQHRKVNTYKH